jgi:cytoplasmic iron level regulating protein YaaA (DUF328/UPF0246 family)
MLSILSPAKTLDMESVAPYRGTSPDYLIDSQNLISILKKKSISEIGSLMSLSEKLSQLNHQRYQTWNPDIEDNTRPAMYCFKGDVYQGLEAHQFNQSQVEFAQSHLRILSGLYGVLKPLDAINPYRLEMGTQLVNSRGENLYDFWQTKLTNAFSDELKNHKNRTIINLASQEYSKAIKLSELDAQIITPVFKDEKNGVYKIISFYAKKARGMMAAYIIKNQLTEPNQLQNFSIAGYRFIEQISHKGNEIQLLFQRTAQS